jgi:hypothetical protein
LVLGGAEAGAASEEVAHAWNFAFTGPGPEDRTPAQDLRQRILREAVGFYGSRALVPDRPFWHPRDQDAPPETTLGTLQKLVRSHLTPRLEVPDSLLERLYREDLESYLGLAHLVGYMLGGTWPRSSQVSAQVFRTPPWTGSLEAEDLWPQAWDWAGFR